MEFYGCFNKNDHYDLVFIGNPNELKNASSYKITQAFAMSETTLDYDEEAFVVELDKNATLEFNQKVKLAKELQYSLLLKENKKIKFDFKENIVLVTIKK